MDLMIYYEYTTGLITGSGQAVSWVLWLHDKTRFSIGLKRFFWVISCKTTVFTIFLRLPISCLINVGRRRVFFTFIKTSGVQK